MKELNFKTCRLLKEAGFLCPIDNSICETFMDIFGLQEIYNIKDVSEWLKEHGIIIDINSETINEDIVKQLEEKGYV